jgi:hypothetical protein
LLLIHSSPSFKSWRTGVGKCVNGHIKRFKVPTRNRPPHSRRQLQRQFSTKYWHHGWRT